MKTPQEILIHAAELKREFREAEQKYYKLHQIDMLSSEGNMLREQMANLTGQVKALGWVIYDEPIKTDVEP